LAEMTASSLVISAVRVFKRRACALEMSEVLCKRPL
jgi:hypothetical protein